MKWNWLSMQLRLWSTSCGSRVEILLLLGFCFAKLSCPDEWTRTERCSLLTLNVSCIDSVADVAVVSRQWNLTPSPKAENTAGLFASLFPVFSLVFAGQAFLSAPEKVTVRAHGTAWFILHCQTGSAEVVYREGRQAEWMKGMPELLFRWCCRRHERS